MGICGDLWGFVGIVGICGDLWGFVGIWGFRAAAFMIQSTIENYLLTDNAVSIVIYMQQNTQKQIFINVYTNYSYMHRYDIFNSGSHVY